MPVSVSSAYSTMRLVSSLCSSVGISAARFLSAQPYYCTFATSSRSASSSTAIWMMSGS